MTAFKDALTSSVRRAGPACGVKAYAAMLAVTPGLPLTAEEFMAEVDDLTLYASVLARALTNLASTVPDGRLPLLSQNVITYHRRGDCTGCGK